MYPRTYDPSYAIGACALALVFASTFSLIFPLMAPAVVLLVFLTLIGKSLLLIGGLFSILTDAVSASLLGRICLCSHTLANWWPSANMAPSALRNPSFTPAYPVGIDSFDTAILDRRRHPRRLWSFRYNFCGVVCPLEDQAARPQIVEPNHTKFIRYVRDRRRPVYQRGNRHIQWEQSSWYSDPWLHGFCS